MAIILDVEVKELQGEPFYDDSLAESFRKAKKFAGEKGFVASFNDLVHGRIIAPPGNVIWQNWYTPNSEELVGITKQGNKVFVVNHDITVLTPDVLEEAIKNPERITSQYAVRITDEQVQDLLSGKIKPVFSFEDLKNETVLPRSYAVVIDFDIAKRTETGYQNADKLPENQIFVARAGTIDQTIKYVQKAKTVYNTDKLGNWHLLNNIDSTQPQGRVPFLGIDDLDGGSNLYSLGRFVGVAPEAPVGKKIFVTPKLEQILKSAKPFVPEAAWKDFSAKISALYK